MLWTANREGMYEDKMRCRHPHGAPVLGKRNSERPAQVSITTFIANSMRSLGGILNGMPKRLVALSFRHNASAQPQHPLIYPSGGAQPIATRRERHAPRPLVSECRSVATSSRPSFSEQAALPALHPTLWPAAELAAAANVDRPPSECARGRYR